MLGFGGRVRRLLAGGCSALLLLAPGAMYAQQATGPRSLLEQMDSGRNPGMLLVGYGTVISFHIPSEPPPAAGAEADAMIDGRYVSVLKLSYRWGPSGFLIKGNEVKLRATGEPRYPQDYVVWSPGDGRCYELDGHAADGWSSDRLAGAVVTVADTAREPQGYLGDLFQLDFPGPGNAADYLGRLSGRRVDVIGEQPLAGLDCIHLAYDDSGGGAGEWGEVHLWVAPARNHRFVRRESFHAVSGDRLRATVVAVTEFREVAPGVWLPAVRRETSHMRMPDRSWRPVFGRYVVSRAVRVADPGAELFTPVLPNNTLTIWPDGREEQWGDYTKELEQAIVAGNPPLSFELPEFLAELPESVR